jgi:hypothetical protein
MSDPNSAEQQQYHHQQQQLVGGGDVDGGGFRNTNTNNVGPCSLGSNCKALQEELSQEYRCRLCGKQLHGFTSSCSIAKNSKDFRDGVICRDQPCTDCQLQGTQQQHTIATNSIGGASPPQKRAPQRQKKDGVVSKKRSF